MRRAIGQIPARFDTVRKMTKIMYGYSGEGSGHSTRTREMARVLIDAGDEVRLTKYDRGYDNLTGEFDVFESLTWLELGLDLDFSFLQ